MVFARARDSSGCMNCATEAPHQLWEAEFGLVLKTAGFMDEMNGNFEKLEVFGTGIIQFLSISDIFSVFCVFLFQLFDIIKQIF